jgi:hypothetical protein
LEYLVKDGEDIIGFGKIKTVYSGNILSKDYHVILLGGK